MNKLPIQERINRLKDEFKRDAERMFLAYATDLHYLLKDAEEEHNEQNDS